MTLTPQNLFLVGASIGVLIYLVVKVLQRRDVRRQSRVSDSPTSVPSVSPQPASLDSLDVELPDTDPADYLFGAATPVMAALLPTRRESRLRMIKTLKNAGYYSLHAWQNFAAVHYVSLVLPLIFFLGLLVIAPREMEWIAVCGLVIGPALGWALPGLMVRGQAAERLRQIEIAMPDMLDLLNMCVGQGMTVPAALRRVGQELAPVYPALAKELRIVDEQTRVGRLELALAHFGKRVDVPEVHSFTSLLTQTERLGTSLSDALESYSDNMREGLKQRADEKANAATFKLLFPTVVFLMPAVYLFLLGPAVIELNRFFASGGAAEVAGAPTQVSRFTDEGR